MCIRKVYSLVAAMILSLTMVGLATSALRAPTSDPIECPLFDEGARQRLTKPVAVVQPRFACAAPRNGPRMEAGQPISWCEIRAAQVRQFDDTIAQLGIVL